MPRILMFAITLVLFTVAHAAPGGPAESHPDFKSTEQISAPQFPAVALWWERGRNGNFWSLDVGPGGYAFVQFSTFDEQRQPISLTMQGQLLEPDEQQQAEGFAVRLASPLYELRGGRCLGCQFSAAEVTPSRFGLAELLFRSPTQGEFRWADQVFEIERFPLFNRAEDGLAERLSGRYALSWHSPDGERRVATVDLEAAPAPLKAWQIRHGLELAAGVYGPTAFSGYINQILGLQLEVEPGSDQLRAGVRRSDDILACGRICSCPPGYNYQYLFRPVCVPDDFASRELIALSAGEADGVLNLNNAPGSQGSAAIFGDYQLRKLAAPNSTPRTASEPVRGLWWEAAGNGQFWSVDIGAGGYVFVNYATFDAAGNPTFLTMQGQYQPAVGSDGQPIGRLRSPLYRLRSGQCLGCSFQPASIEVSEFGLAEIEFHTSQRADFIWNNQRIPIRRFPLYYRAQDQPNQRLQGNYSLVSIGASTSYRLGVVLEPHPPQCPHPAGTVILRLRCLICGPNYQEPESFAGLLSDVEIHVAPSSYTELTALRIQNGTCTRFGRLDEREGRLDLSIDGNGSYLQLLPLPPASNSIGTQVQD